MRRLDENVGKVIRDGLKVNDVDLDTRRILNKSEHSTVQMS